MIIRITQGRKSLGIHKNGREKYMNVEFEIYDTEAFTGLKYL
jgi:hypothetical protein